MGMAKQCFHSSIMELYRNECLSIGGTTVDIACYTAHSQALMKKIKDKYGEKISVVTFDKRKGNVL